MVVLTDLHDSGAGGLVILPTNSNTVLAICGRHSPMHYNCTGGLFVYQIEDLQINAHYM